METDDQALLRKAKATALSLGITVYIRPDGHIYQHPPGRQIIPPASSQPEIGGRGGSAISEGASS